MAAEDKETSELFKFHWQNTFDNIGYDTMPICLYKQGFIILSFILQAVKCHAASRARNVVANPIAR
jgi:hypothetical protein